MRIGGAAFACLVLLLPGIAGAGSNQSGPGLGGMLGEPTGLSGKLWVSRDNAFAGGAGWSQGKNDELRVHLDYLWHNLNIINPGKDEIPFHYGLGVWIETQESEDDSFGVRFPLGFGFWRSGAAFDLFIEFVPKMMLSPEAEFEVGAAIGARYFF